MIMPVNIWSQQSIPGTGAGVELAQAHHHRQLCSLPAHNKDPGCIHMSQCTRHRRHSRPTSLNTPACPAHKPPATLSAKTAACLSHPLHLAANPKAPTPLHMAHGIGQKIDPAAQATASAEACLLLPLPRTTTAAAPSAADTDNRSKLHRTAATHAALLPAACSHTPHSQLKSSSCCCFKQWPPSAPVPQLPSRPPPPQSRGSPAPCSSQQEAPAARIWPWLLPSLPAAPWPWRCLSWLRGR